jgi:membrane protein YdbS with pleckstrin-like domain
MRDSWFWVTLGPGVGFAELLLVVALTADRQGKVFQSAWMVAWPGGLAVYQFGVFRDSRWLAAAGIALTVAGSIVILVVGGTRWRKSS